MEKHHNLQACLVDDVSSVRMLAQEVGKDRGNGLVNAVLRALSEQLNLRHETELHSYAAFSYMAAATTANSSTSSSLIRGQLLEGRDMDHMDHGLTL